MINSIDEKLKQIVSERSFLELSLEDITDDSNLINDFGFDSMSMVQLIVDIQSKFDIKFEDKHLTSIVTGKFGTIKECIYEKLNSKS